MLLQLAISMTKLWKLKKSAKRRAEQLRKELEKGGKLSSTYRPAWRLLHLTQGKARAAAGNGFIGCRYIGWVHMVSWSQYFAFVIYQGNQHQRQTCAVQKERIV